MLGAFPLLVALLAASTLAGDELSERKVRSATSASVRGFKALEEGDLSRASQLFEEALGHVRNFPNARVGLGHVAYARRQYEAALSHYTVARDEITRLNRDARSGEFTRYEEAQRRILGFEDDIRTLRSLPGADVESQVRELERAIEEMKRVHRPVRRDPDPPPADLFFHRGNALFHLGRLDDAIADWTACATIDPKFAAVHNNLAVAHWRLGHREQARAELGEARRRGAKIDVEFERRLAEPGG